MAFDPPPLPQTQPSWPQMQVWWQQVLEALKTQLVSLEDAIEAVAAAQSAADAAQAAADTATSAAASATTAATSAQSTANAITEATSLGDSFPVGATISASDAGTDTTITISAHTRRYPQPDGTYIDVSVNGGSQGGFAYSAFYYVYYDDPTRAGGAVTYVFTTDATVAVQSGARHVVGGVSTPAAAAPPTSGTLVKGRGSGDLTPEP